MLLPFLSIMLEKDKGVCKKSCGELAPEFTVQDSPKGNGASRIYLSSIDDLYKLEQLIVTAYEEADHKE